MFFFLLDSWSRWSGGSTSVHLAKQLSIAGTIMHLVIIKYIYYRSYHDQLFACNNLRVYTMETFVHR